MDLSLFSGFLDVDFGNKYEKTSKARVDNLAATFSLSCFQFLDASQSVGQGAVRLKNK
jgi:hypothetical protein